MVFCKETVKKTMIENRTNANFDQYISDLHENLDRLRDLSDIDEQSSAIVADLAQAYSEHPSAMQTGEHRSKSLHMSISFLFKSCVYQLYFLDKRIF